MGWVVSATPWPLLSPGKMLGSLCNYGEWAEIHVLLYSVVRTLSKWQSSFCVAYCIPIQAQGGLFSALRKSRKRSTSL